MFTASPSPANIAAASAALKSLAADSSMRERLWENAKRIHAAFEQLGFDLCAPTSPVIAVKLADRDKAFWAWNFLMDNGVYVNLAIPPGTPNATSILRLSVSAAHTNEDLDIVVNAYTQLSDALISAANV